MGIQGKIALVTGAAQGIGEAVARILAKHGVLVAAVDQNEEGLHQLIKDFMAQGYQGQAFPVDISDGAAVKRAVDTIERVMGPIEILVNVAGILRTGSIETMTEKDWEDSFAVNATGVFYVSRAVVQYMIPRKSGSIVTVGSNAAGVPRMFMAAYASSKAAATMFTKCLGLEIAQYGIRCNVVSPGSTETAMQRSMWTDEHGEEEVVKGSSDSFRLGIPLGKLATPLDIARGVLFLVSDLTTHITMHDLRIDGGATLGL